VNIPACVLEDHKPFRGLTTPKICFKYFSEGELLILPYMRSSMFECGGSPILSFERLRGKGEKAQKDDIQ